MADYILLALWIGSISVTSIAAGFTGDETEKLQTTLNALNAHITEYEAKYNKLIRRADLDYITYLNDMQASFANITYNQQKLTKAKAEFVLKYRRLQLTSLIMVLFVLAFFVYKTLLKY